MTPTAAGIADWVVRNRAKFPGWLNRIIELPARKPDGLIGRLTIRVLGSGHAPVTSVPTSAVRVYIAPTNYSGQAYAWARALEAAATDLSARNMAIDVPGGFTFAADTVVPFGAAQSSAAWAEEEWRAVQQFTHVLIEAERPIFGQRFDRDVAQEVLALEGAGVSVAYLCHGTDIRDPDAHALRTPWSPYPDDPRTDTLRADAARNLQLLTEMRRPTFVSTPDLLFDVPWAQWCPVVVDSTRFVSPRTPFRDGPVRVVHAASAPVQKGSDYIPGALSPLIEAGLVNYQLITGIPSAQIPEVFNQADIVIDQFRLGSYGVAACEAMAAGRVVVGHVLPEVRQHVENTYGLALPIVESTPDTLHDVIESLVSDPDKARARAESGPAFVERVHSGRASAAVLLAHWIRPAA